MIKCRKQKSAESRVKREQVDSPTLKGKKRQISSFSNKMRMRVEKMESSRAKKKRCTLMMVGWPKSKSRERR